MASDRPSIRQLEYLVAVSETLNFRQAAERCFVTQPALSTQLQQLEQTLGVQLFERDKRSVLPTAAGRDLAERAKRVLGEVDLMGDRAKSYQEPLEGTLRLGVIPTIAPYLLPKVLDKVSSRFDDLRLLLREDYTHRLVELLGRGELDLLLLALEVELGDAEEFALFEDPFYLAVSPEHPLAKKDLVAEKDLWDQTVLLLEEGHCLRTHAMPICKQAGASEFGDFRASSLTTLVQMVASGVGLTLIPEMAIEVTHQAAPNLVIRPFDANGPGRRIGLAWRKASSRGEEFKLLGEAIRDAYFAAE